MAWTNSRLLKIARSSLHDGPMLSAQRMSAYLSIGELTKFVLNHCMVQVNSKLMNVAAKHGYLDSMKILRRCDPPCPWNVSTCNPATEYDHLHVLQWIRSQDPTCPWNEETYSVYGDY